MKSAGLEDVQAGDVVCRWKDYNSQWGAALVTRTTTHRIYIGEGGYDRKTGRQRGAGLYSYARIEPLTPVRIEEARLDSIERARVQAVHDRVNRIRTHSLRELTVDQLERILAIIGEAKR